jgi:hypothetical protein
VSIETVKKRVPTAKRATHTPKTLAKAIADYQMKGGVKRGIDADESSTRPTKALQKQKNLPILGKNKKYQKVAL